MIFLDAVGAISQSDCLTRLVSVALDLGENSAEKVVVVDLSQ